MTRPWKRWIDRAAKLRHHPTPGRFLLSRLLWAARVSHLFTIELPEGLRLRFYPSSISAALFVSAGARSEDAEFLRLVLHPGDTYLDCGANVGHLAVIARALVGSGGAVTAIEPNPRISSYCRGNLALNGFTDVDVLNLALGESPGTIRISDRRDDDQNRVGEGSDEVSMRPLDEVVTATQVSLLKLDVEGFELQVLRGAPATLARTNIVYCELSRANSARFGYQPEQTEDLLLAAGFLLARRTEAGWKVGRRRIFDTLINEQGPRTGFNVVAIRPTVMPMFEARVAAHGQRVITI